METWDIDQFWKIAGRKKPTVDDLLEEACK